MTVRRPSEPSNTPPCANCRCFLTPIYAEHHAVALQAISAGHALRHAFEQAQLFWSYEEVRPLFNALETGQVFEDAPLEVLSTISERIFYHLTDEMPAYEPILRTGSTAEHPMVDPAMERARKLWEAIRTFKHLQQMAFDYSLASAFCRRQSSI